MANKVCHDGEDRHPVTDNIDIWISAQIKKNGTGRGNGSANQSLYGIKKLRELILELAVRGNLVPQDPKDKPASVLLEKIAKEKARLIKEGKIKKEKPLPKVSEDDNPFELPQGWEWVRLIDIGILENGDRSKNYPNKSALVEKGIPFINAGHLQNGKINMAGMNYISNTRFNLLRSGKVKDGDILYCLRGSLGKTAIVHDINSGAIASSLVIIRLFSQLYNQFIHCYFGSPLSISTMKKYDNGTAQPNLSATDLGKFVIGLPPLSEQHRIVAKVDELMALCDKLEQQQADSNAAHQTLVETLLSTLTSVANANEFKGAWQRIADNFDILFTTEQSIDQLKQTILQLAVMGKLVPQGPKDEPASVLLEKIAKEKARLIKEGKIKKEKPLPEITEDEKPFQLPHGWQFVRLSDLSQLITKGSSPNWQGVAYTEDIEDVLFITSENVGSYLLELDNKKYVEKKFNDIEPRSILKKGDFLMNIVGASIGRTAIYDIDNLANINQAVCLIRLFPNFLNSKYFLHFFNSAICISYMFDKQVDNARANLSMGNIAKFVIPFPPLAEQHRIVAKVDELMAICDMLKARLQEAQTTKIHLADAIVEHAVG